MEIVEQTGLVAPTAHRLLRTLVDHGLLAQEVTTKAYRPGLKLFELSSYVVQGLELRHEAQPELRQLSGDTDETVHLAVLDEGEVVYIDKVETAQTIRMYSAVGKRAPAHCTGVGKVLLAYLPAEEFRGIIREHGLRAYTGTTITSVEALEREFALINDRSYAIDDGEHEPEIRCVACPIRDHTGRVVAAASVTAPASRMSLERVEALAPLVRRCADRISERLGYVPHDGHVAVVK
jgi:DNA-binding IclR family transcriptional regulator